MSGSLAKRGKSDQGFTLVEMIAALVVAAAFFAFLVQFVGSSFTGSVSPVLMADRNFALQQTAERIIAAYKSAIANDTLDLSTINFGTLIPADMIFTQSFITFDAGGQETACASGCTILKVRLTQGSQYVVMLFTQ